MTMKPRPYTRGFTRTLTFASREAQGRRPMRKLVSGFTLIETLVAIAILTLAVVGPLYTADRALVSAQLANQQLTASYLAQEGVEYVRGLRDDAYLSTYRTYQNTSGVNISDTAWASFLTTSVGSCRSGTCSYDPSYGLSACSGSSCPTLYLANGSYTTQSGRSGAKVTPYTRSIQVENITPAPPNDAKGNPIDVEVVSTVTWNFHGVAHSVDVTEDLTPWQ